MRMKTIEVPDYVADRFNQVQGHPSHIPGAVDKSIDRVYRLIAHALQKLERAEWEINENLYFSNIRNEPFGFCRVGNIFYIYAEERGRRDPLAIFESSHLAADYFVWLVSKGTRIIDWSLFLDMET